MAKKSVNEALLIRIGQRIKELREKKGVTQETFYHDTGINIGRIERAKRNISVTTLSQVCEYLEIELNDFFDKI